MDFCCNGNQKVLENACEEKSFDIKTLIDELKEVNSQKRIDHDYISWDINFLSDYIYNNHHKYVEKKIPEIKGYLDKLCKVHGSNHPELFEIQKLFSDGANELTMHMKKEEIILFPYFHKLAKALEFKDHTFSSQLKSIENPIAVMHKEHDNEGERFRKIRKLTNDYTLPNDACGTYKVTFSLLKEFEEDLHKHIHLENNILFVKALKIEGELMQRT
ncbi:MAG: iron-sulfur cluster repair di-iron protein [Chitinophagales bacterium]